MELVEPVVVTVFETALTRAAPTNDYAHFCLGRALQQLGRHREACRPLAIAACLRPERAEYRAYRDRARRAAAGSHSA